MIVSVHPHQEQPINVPQPCPCPAFPAEENGRHAQPYCCRHCSGATRLRILTFIRSISFALDGSHAARSSFTGRPVLRLRRMRPSPAKLFARTIQSQQSVRGPGRSTIAERSVLKAITREPIQFSDAAALVARIALETNRAEVP
jgi:hypothetical protein